MTDNLKQEAEEVLKPCPFCGRIPPTVITGAQDIGYRYKIGCCVYVEYPNELDAIEVWNTRPIEAKQDTRIAELEGLLKDAENLTTFQSKRAVRKQTEINAYKHLQKTMDYLALHPTKAEEESCKN